MWSGFSRTSFVTPRFSSRLGCSCPGEGERAFPNLYHQKDVSRAQALFSFCCRFLLPASFPLNSQWGPLLRASSARRQGKATAQGRARVGFPTALGATCLSRARGRARPSRLLPPSDWVCEVTWEPRAGILSCGSWHSFFFFFFKSLGLLSSAGLGASLSDWGWRQTETATRADWGGRRKSAGMLSQGPRTPASGCYYLNAMTPEGQEMYLRFDQTTRRSPYRMSRILARHQLVTKIQQGESLVVEGCC